MQKCARAAKISKVTLGYFFVLLGIRRWRMRTTGETLYVSLFLK